MSKKKLLKECLWFVEIASDWNLNEYEDRNGEWQSTYDLIDKLRKELRKYNENS